MPWFRDPSCCGQESGFSIVGLALAWLVLSGCGRISYEPLPVIANGPADAAVTADAEIGGDGSIDGDSGFTGGASGRGDGSVGGAGGVGGTGGNGATVSCSDGSQNGDESGTDCGDVCSACPTCGDGIQNQNETGVDCGGVCSACPTCSDGVQNQDGVDCGGVCGGTCAPNTPPVAYAMVTPGLGWFDTGSPTTFLADGTGSYDLEDTDPLNLSYDWDWDGDGTYEASGRTPPGHVYTLADTYNVVLRVTDTGGLSAVTDFVVIVRATSDVITVTTGADENDDGATPGNPQNTGFSLREAIRYVGDSGVNQSIYVPPGTVINLESGNIADPIGANGLDVIADGVVVDGAGVGNSTCFFVNASNTRFFGIELLNCAARSFHMSGSNNMLSRAYLHDNNQGVLMQGTGNTLSYSELDGNGPDGVSVDGVSSVLFNRIHGHSGMGIELDRNGDDFEIIGNIIDENGIGIGLDRSSDTTIVKNTIAYNTGDAVNFSGNISGTIFQNNLVSHNTGWAITGDSGVFGTRSHNAYFSNSGGLCSGCLAVGTSLTSDDPPYINATGDD